MQVCNNSVIRFADRFKGVSSICMVCNYVAGASSQPQVLHVHDADMLTELLASLGRYMYTMLTCQLSCWPAWGATCTRC